MKLTIRVWRQPSSDRAGFFEEHVLEGADAKRAGPSRSSPSAAR